MCKEFQLWGQDMSKTVQLWVVLGELANINLIMEVVHYIQLGGYEEDKSYNYQGRELKLMCKDIMA